MAEERKQLVTRIEQIEKRLATLEAKMEKPKRLTRNHGSLIDHIVVLREDGFFTKPRTITDIKVKLSERGYSCPITTLSPLLLRLVRNNQLKREMTADGFKYSAP